MKSVGTRTEGSKAASEQGLFHIETMTHRYVHQRLVATCVTAHGPLAALGLLISSHLTFLPPVLLLLLLLLPPPHAHLSCHASSSVQLPACLPRPPMTPLPALEPICTGGVAALFIPSACRIPATHRLLSPRPPRPPLPRCLVATSRSLTPHPPPAPATCTTPATPPR